MCHLIRDADFERQRAQQTSLPPSEATPAPRPRRLAGAVAAAVVVAAVAVVALLFPASTPAVPDAAAVPMTPVVVEQTASGQDDDVPSVASRVGGCSGHEL